MTKVLQNFSNIAKYKWSIKIDIYQCLSLIDSDNDCSLLVSNIVYY